MSILFTEADWGTTDEGWGEPEAAEETWGTDAPATTGKCMLEDVIYDLFILFIYFTFIL